MPSDRATSTIGRAAIGGTPRAGALALAAALLLAVALVAFATGATGPNVETGGHVAVAPARTQPARLSPFAAAEMSATLGAEQPAYRVAATRSGLVAVNGAQHIRARFGRTGAVVSGATSELGMRLAAVRSAGAARAVGAVAPRARANRVSYEHGFIGEWYANGPFGLEQGFTIPRAPFAHARGALTLELALSGDAHAALVGHTALTLTHAGGPGLLYGHAFARDAAGRSVPVSLALRHGRLLLNVDTRGARYPLTIDPLFQQGGKLTAAEEIGGAYFGFAVALSGDGNTALIGGYRDNGGAGAAWVFTRSGETWTQRAKLALPPDGAGAVSFGGSVALSADGTTALVGATGGAGGAWVFTGSGEAWSEQAKLPGPANTGFGVSVSLSGDGNTALVGSIVSHSTTATVFARSGAEWTQQQVLAPSDAGAFVGGFMRVALSADGSTALIANPYDSPEPNANVGAAWIFQPEGGEWVQRGHKLTGAGEIGGGLFGWSVALSGDGSTAIIGARDDNGGVGAAWVFARAGEEWLAQGEKLTGESSCCTLFGESVALSAGGDSALVGAYYQQGQAWQFSRSGSTWTHRGAPLSSGESGYPFGTSVALSSDGDTALVGGGGEGVAASIGAAWVFAEEPAKAPAVVTGSGAWVAQRSATLAASVNPDGEAVSDCHFEYGTSPSYGASVPCTASPGAGTRAVPVSAQISQPSANRTYHFRIVATNPLGTSYGEDHTFVTPPYPVDIGRCVRVPTGTGTYRNAGCTLLGEKSTQRLYEWHPGLIKARFSTHMPAGTKATIATAVRSQLTCTGESGNGEHSGSKSLVGVVLTFTGCERLGAKCSSSGAAAGEVVTHPLEGVFGVITAGVYSYENKLGLDLFPVGHTGSMIDLTCGGAEGSVRGAVIVPVTGANVGHLSVTLAYAGGKGVQHVLSFAGEPRETLEASFGGGPFEAADLSMKTVQTNEEKVELNTVL
jgi:hypothetical protein